MLSRIQRIHKFWYPEVLPYANWFKKDPSFDNEIRENFAGDLQDLADGKLDSWLETPEGTLSYIILSDQFSRNLFRNDPKCFSYDPKAISATKHALKEKYNEKLNLFERVFLYMPLMHAEDKQDQQLGVNLFADLIDLAEESKKPVFKNFHSFAIMHQKIIDRFGRFPHRNVILSRTTTQEEADFLKNEHSGF
jgi:uncharacterized protein (DUF924 family)